MTTHADQVADAVRAVLEAARTMRRDETWPHAAPHPGELFAAVDALDALMTADAVTEEPLPWSEVMADDETQGADGNWYRVVSVSTARKSGTVEVAIDVRGTVRWYTKPGDVTVPVRRKVSPEAAAVAMLRAAGFDLITLTSGGN